MSYNSDTSYECKTVLQNCVSYFDNTLFELLFPLLFPLLQGVLSVKKVLDRENSEMTLDAGGRGVFSLDITATDQALPNNTRKSSTVRVR